MVGTNFWYPFGERTPFMQSENWFLLFCIFTMIQKNLQVVSSCIKSNTWMFHVQGHYCTQLCPWNDWGFGSVVKWAKTSVRNCYFCGEKNWCFRQNVLYNYIYIHQLDCSKCAHKLKKIKSFMFWRHVVSMFYQNCRYDGSQASSSISSKVDEALQSVLVFWTDLPAALKAGSRKL